MRLQGAPGVTPRRDGLPLVSCPLGEPSPFHPPKVVLSVPHSPALVYGRLRGLHTLRAFFFYVLISLGLQGIPGTSGAQQTSLLLDPKTQSLLHEEGWEKEGPYGTLRLVGNCR